MKKQMQRRKIYDEVDEDRFMGVRYGDRLDV